MLRFCLLSALTALVSCQNCPDGWQMLDKRCYKKVDTPMPWDNATRYCADNSPYNYGHLATVHSEQENEFLTHIVLGGGIRAWIGLNDKAKENEWVWDTYNEEPFIEPVNFWKTGEPNDGNGMGEDCVEINRGGPGRWNDCKCRKALPFVCEVELYTIAKGGQKARHVKTEARFEERV